MRYPILEVWAPAARSPFSKKKKKKKKLQPRHKRLQTNILLSDTLSKIRDQNDVRMVIKQICDSVGSWLKSLFVLQNFRPCSFPPRDPITSEKSRADSSKTMLHESILHMSRLMGKPTICIGENKDADQLRGNREADQAPLFSLLGQYNSSSS